MISIVGLGYIGLPTALMLATHGMDVVGTDINRDLIEKLKNSGVSFVEDGMEELFDAAINQGIRFSDEYQATDVYIVSVPTPYDSFTKKIDARYVEDAIRSIVERCPKGAIVVVESTIPPGTMDGYIRPIFKENGLIVGEDVHLAHAPERIIPGNIINELIDNPRIVGVDDPHVGERVKGIYSSFCKAEIVITDIRTAEITKVVENTFRDVNIAYANELAKICRYAGLDIYEIIRIANMHPRVNILNPGPGVGGHCISVDPWFLVGDYPGLANIILAARKINDSMPEFVLERVYEIMREKKMTEIGRVGLYGLTYKEDVDDMRESPTLQMIMSMRKHLSGDLVKVYDPYVNHDIVPNQYHDLDDFLENVDFVVVLVGHGEIKKNVGKLLGKVVLDTRNVCDLEGVYKL